MITLEVNILCDGHRCPERLTVEARSVEEVDQAVAAEVEFRKWTPTVFGRHFCPHCRVQARGTARGYARPT